MKCTQGCTCSIYNGPQMKLKSWEGLQACCTLEWSQSSKMSMGVVSQAVMMLNFLLDVASVLPVISLEECSFAVAYRLKPPWWLTAELIRFQLQLHVDFICVACRALTLSHSFLKHSSQCSGGSAWRQALSPSHLFCSFLSLSLKIASAPVNDDRDALCSEIIAQQTKNNA